LERSWSTWAPATWSRWRVEDQVPAEPSSSALGCAAEDGPNDGLRVEDQARRWEGANKSGRRPSGRRPSGRRCGAPTAQPCVVAGPEAGALRGVAGPEAGALRGGKAVGWEAAHQDGGNVPLGRMFYIPGWCEAKPQGEDEAFTFFVGCRVSQGSAVALAHKATNGFLSSAERQGLEKVAGTLSIGGAAQSKKSTITLKMELFSGFFMDMGSSQ